MITLGSRDILSSYVDPLERTFVQNQQFLVKTDPEAECLRQYFPDLLLEPESFERGSFGSVPS